MSIELSKLLKALSEGVTTVTFEKIDTKELRVMPCTTCLLYTSPSPRD